MFYFPLVNNLIKVTFVLNFTEFGLNSILFQRGIGPAKSFIGEDHYGLTIFMSTDPKIRDYLCFTLAQVEGRLVFY